MRQPQNDFIDKMLKSETIVGLFVNKYHFILWKPGSFFETQCSLNKRHQDTVENHILLLNHVLLFVPFKQGHNIIII